MESAGEKGKVCVTGGTGFIGSWLIMRLLDQGYSVTTTIRPNQDDQQQKRDLSFLTSLPGASERLKIFTADLRTPETFSPAIEGCVGVFHVATPVDFEQREPEEAVTKRSVQGALSILKTCLDSKTVKRVVYTSSVSAVRVNGGSDPVVDETSWSSVDYIRGLKVSGGPYMISKTLTEKAVIEFSEMSVGLLEVVTVIPSLVVGPFICPKIPSSVDVSFGLVFGKNNKTFGFGPGVDLVHVDDVARAHIFLFEHPEAKGRYNCTLKTTSVKSVSAFISARYPELNIRINDSESEGQHKFSTLSPKKLIDLGFEYKYSVEEMFDDAIKCCKEKGFL